MNRAQRRAQLKNAGRKFEGFKVTNGKVEVPVEGKEPIIVDLMNFDVIYALGEMSTKFSNIQEEYKEEYAAATDSQNSNPMAILKLYKHISEDFCVLCERAFGEGSVLAIFGNNAPMPSQISEFLEDAEPILAEALDIMRDETRNTKISAPSFNVAEVIEFND